MQTLILSATMTAGALNGPVAYLLGAILSVFVLGYLVLTLVKPEKF
jgi:K+-transporting ATPase KdpF subunit